MSAALRAASLSDDANRSTFAPVTSTHWLVSSGVTGASSTGLFAADAAAEDLPDEAG
ncbi:MAG TPA: hypothetical protein VML93_37610 [Mycobacterium sp.]|nr:hypothetical protein [Mycobacterium sp.]